MRRPSQDARLPPWAIQVFGLAIVTAITVYAITAESSEIILAVLALAGGAVGVGGYFEKVNREVKQALTPPENDRRPGS